MTTTYKHRPLASHPPASHYSDHNIFSIQLLKACNNEKGVQPVNHRSNTTTYFIPLLHLKYSNRHWLSLCWIFVHCLLQGTLILLRKEKITGQSYFFKRTTCHQEWSNRFSSYHQNFTIAITSKILNFPSRPSYQSWLLSVTKRRLVSSCSAYSWPSLPQASHLLRRSEPSPCSHNRKLCN